MTEHITRVAIVTPHVWEQPHPVNDYVIQLAEGLRARTPAVESVVIAPSNTSRARRAARRALRDLARGGDVTDILAARELQAAGDVTLLALALPVPIGSQSVALRAGLRQLFHSDIFDLLVVQDPLLSDLTRQSLKEWPGLAVGTFHAPVGPGGLGITAPLRERIFEAIDVLCVADDAVPDAAQQVVELSGVTDDVILRLPVLARPEATIDGSHPDDAPIVVGRGLGDDEIVQDIVRNIDDLAPDGEHLTLLTRWDLAHRPVVSRTKRERIHSIHAKTPAAALDVLRTARRFVTTDRTPLRAVREAQAAGLDVVRWPPGTDANTPPAGELPRPRELTDPIFDRLTPLIELRSGSRRSSIPRRQDPHACLIDLHMHTNHSWDCATEPRALLEAAREAGLTAIAVTDHDEVSGGLACAELADEYGVQVIVGEEVKTAQGEVIGLFLQERIEPGMSWIETIAAIRRQDGIVYVPHPFDRLHTIPDIHTLRASVDEIDVLEVANGRLAFEQFNRDAKRFARKYNLLEGAGSDAHVTQGLASAAVRMPTFNGPESFLTAIRQGEIERRSSSYLYVQAIKRIEQIRGKAGSARADR